MDNFKKYLLENRDGLDVEKAPRPQVWQHIQQHTPAREKTGLQPVIKWVAAAGIIILAGATVIFLKDNTSGTPDEAVASTTQNDKHPEPEGRTDSSSNNYLPYTSETNAVLESPGEIKQPGENNHPVKIEQKKNSPAKPRELTLVEAVDNNYSPIIASQLKKLEKTPIYAESPEYFNDLKKQWQNLEKDEKKVKQDIDTVGLNDNIMAQLVRIYQQKLLLLKQLQHEINKMNNQVKKYPSFLEKEPSYLKL